MSQLYDKLIRPVLFGMDPESAHELGLETLRLALSSEYAQRAARNRFAVDVFGDIERFGLKFRNPLGVAAGFDKNGVVVNQLASLGFGFVEVGTVTHRPQEGNEKPRMFRLPEDQAIINRLGFNNEGTEAVIDRLKSIDRKCVVGVNIGRNKDVPNEEAIGNYLESYNAAFDTADYVAVNVSSPNTSGLRELQKADSLQMLLASLQERNRRLSGDAALKPLFVKIAPDLSDDEVIAITDICTNLKITGIIATNTTVARENLRTSDPDRSRPGGLSGKPLFQRSNDVISLIYRHSEGQMPVIGVGGIFNAEDAFSKIAAGACLIQAYTGFIYKGPGFARDVSRELASFLKQMGFANLDEAIGSAA
ncbi:MAG: quinone-dependent dihydroorotate dehydrogenase [Pyrinomonadaceae bacterium]